MIGTEAGLAPPPAGMRFTGHPRRHGLRAERTPSAQMIGTEAGLAPPPAGMRFTGHPRRHGLRAERT
ncbi:hypothetical protein CJ430_31910, partial [Klebsiella pneumoniae]